MGGVRKKISKEQKWRKLRREKVMNSIFIGERERDGHFVKRRRRRRRSRQFQS